MICTEEAFWLPSGCECGPAKHYFPILLRLKSDKWWIHCSNPPVLLIYHPLQNLRDLLRPSSLTINILPSSWGIGYSETKTGKGQHSQTAIAKCITWIAFHCWLNNSPFSTLIFRGCDCFLYPRLGSIITCQYETCSMHFFMVPCFDHLSRCGIKTSIWQCFYLSLDESFVEM